MIKVNKMKSKTIILSISLCLMMLTVSTVRCEWSRDIRVLNRPGGSETPRLLIHKGVFHIFFYDWYENEPGIYQAWSSDQGLNWQVQEVTGIPASVRDAKFPHAVSDGEKIHLVWEDECGDAPGIYYRRSSSNGLYWEPSVRINHYVNYSRTPCIAADGSGGIYIAWWDVVSGVTNIYFARSLDGGTTWEWNPDRALTEIEYEVDSEAPRIISSDAGHLYLTWRDNRDGYPQGGYSPYEIYYLRSEDRGEHWNSIPERLSPDLPTSYGISRSPNLYLDGSGRLHLTWWEDNRGDNLYHRFSTDDGITWSKINQLSDFGPEHMPPLNWSTSYTSMCSDESDVLHLVYYSHIRSPQSYRTAGQIFYTRSSDGGANWSEPEIFYKGYTACEPQIASNDGQLYVAWADDRDNYYGNEIYFRTTVEDYPEREGPTIYVGGYWETDLWSYCGGELTLLAYVVDPDGPEDIESVEIYYDSEPLEYPVYLMDDGEHGDFGAGDGVYAVTFDVPSGVPVGDYFFQIAATDSEGNMTLWPYLEVWDVEGNGDFDSASSGGAGISALSPTKIFSSDNKYFSPPGNGLYPLIYCGGFFDTDLTEDHGGVLTVTAFVTHMWPHILNHVELYYDGNPTGCLLKDDGTGPDWSSGDGLFTFAAEIPSGVPSGTYEGFTIVALDDYGAIDEWPYLHIK